MQVQIFIMPFDIYSFNCSIVVVYKKRKVPSEPRARDDYTDMRYDSATESLKAPRKPHLPTALPSHQYTKPPITAVKPTKNIELKENEEFAEDTYESI